MTNRIFRPVYVIEELGELGRVPDGGILNIGGTDGPYFTVAGKPLLFADGSSTGPGSGITLQTVYDNSPDGNIILSSGKDVTIQALNGKQFFVDAATGAVTIQGDLTVLGASTVIEGTVSNLDQVNIGLPNAITTGFFLKPNTGVTPTVDLFQVSHLASGVPDFRIDKDGNVIFAQNITLTGTINGVDITALAQSVSTHLDNSTLIPKHAAAQISYAPGANTVVTATDVQAALDQIDVAFNSFQVSNVQGYEHVQNVASDTWTIVHGANSKRLTCVVWDSTDEEVLADSVQIQSLNTVVVTFNTPITGRAILMIF